MSKWDIKRICEEYEKADPDGRYHIAIDLSSSIGEEKFDDSRQMSLEEAWGIDEEQKDDDERKEGCEINGMV